MTINTAVAEMAELFTDINSKMPEKAKKALEEIGKLDREVQLKLLEVHATKVQFMALYDTLTMDERSKAFNMLEAELQKIAVICNEKVEIANAIRVEISLLHEKFKIGEAKFIENCPPPSGRVTPKSTRRLEDVHVETSEKRGRGRKKKEIPIDKIKKEEVDENEEGEDDRTYCWCQLEKQDQMVCCENPFCKYEWFHFTCIGMIVAPVGDWYCTECHEAGHFKKPRAPGSPEKKARRGPKKRKHN